MSAGTPDPNDADDEDEWRFSVEEVGEDAADGEPTDEPDTDGGNVAGSLVDEGPLEPESITLENAVFFLIGSLGTILFVVLALTGL